MDETTKKWTVIGALVTGAFTLLAVVLEWLLNFFSAGTFVGWIVARANDLYAVLAYPTTLPYWVIGTLATGTLILLGIALFKAYQDYREPDPSEFIGMEMFGVLWTWKWSSTSGPIEPKPLCPHCFSKLWYNRSRSIAFCECDFVKTDLPEDVEVRVRTEVNRLVRLGTYQEHVKDFENRREEARQRETNKSSD